ncbi:terpene synthase family protein [Embleya sp. NPDC020886]|uniref:terpene synthase family protein n=1 Tax=Embleya sp. NPDC020886 TaxID=3363980 RepID=UPI00379EEF6A
MPPEPASRSPRSPTSADAKPPACPGSGSTEPPTTGPERLRACCTETANRLTGTHLDHDDHIARRRKAVAVVPTMDMPERGAHFEAPVLAYHHSHFQHLRRRLATDQIFLVNDLYSLDKEEAAGSPTRSTA